MKDLLTISSIGSIHILGVCLGITVDQASKKLHVSHKCEDWGICVGEVKIDQSIPPITLVYSCDKNKRIHTITISAMQLSKREYEVCDLYFTKYFNGFMLHGLSAEQQVFISNLHTITLRRKQNENGYSYLVTIESRLIKHEDDNNIKSRIFQLYNTPPHPWWDEMSNKKSISSESFKKWILYFVAATLVIFGLFALLNNRYIATDNYIFDQWKGEYVSIYHKR